LFIGCSVYDSSLLEHNPLGAGASDSGGSSGSGDVSLAGSSPVITGGSSNSSAGAGTSIGEAGDNNGGAAGAKEGGSGGSGATTAGGGTAAGAGGLVDVGGSAAGGAANTSLSMIDDMEMPDYYIPQTDGRVGFWSLANDHTAGGVQTPSTTDAMFMSAITGGRGASMYALHTTAAGFKTSGAQVNVDLNRKTARMTYDASAYQALHFFAKLGAAGTPYVTLAVPDLHTDPDGALCDKATGAGSCYDHFATSVTVTTAWTEFTVPFTMLQQAGWGANGVTALDVAHVFSVRFSWGTPSMDLWVDDIAFVKK
jgi:hypothetical protein